MKNEGAIERGIQLTISIVAFAAGFFWLSGIWQAVLLVFSGVLLLFSIIGFCPLYLMFKKNTYQKLTTVKTILLIIFFGASLIGASYGSVFFTKKRFVEDFNKMNGSYKQALFETGQEKRQAAIDNYDRLVADYQRFEQKYLAYHPYSIRNDAAFNSDLKKIEKIILATKENVYSGDLKAAHYQLETIRPITQELLKRNGFSLISISLVDFHDAMEKVLEKANSKDTEGVIAAYQDASAKLKEVEQEANDAEIQAIRKNLDEVLSLARENKADQLPESAANLKSSFIKVYLTRN